MASNSVKVGVFGMLGGLVAGIGIGRASAPTPPTPPPPPPPAPKKGGSSAIKYGAPSREHLRVREGYALAFDSRMRTPRWVSVHLSRDKLYPEYPEGTSRPHRKHCRFEEDGTVDPGFGPKLADYYKSGYDRGHNVAAADVKTSQDAMCETFLLSNIAPQVGKGFNRDIWARFEAFSRNLTKVYDDVYVITGPAWVPVTDPDTGKHSVTYEVIGNPPNVAVPTHWFKAILAESETSDGGNKKVVGAFLMPNQPIDDDAPLTEFALPLGELETLVGLRLFPKAQLGEGGLFICDDTSCKLPPPWSPPKKKSAPAATVATPPAATVATTPAATVATPPAAATGMKNGEAKAEMTDAKAVTTATTSIEKSGETGETIPVTPTPNASV